MTPESRIDMLEDKSAFVERRDETQDASGFAMFIVKTFLQALERRRVCLIYQDSRSEQQRRFGAGT